ncbi:MAG: ABC transporter permease [Xenococcus sp. (in: cyanobacteria)]
MELINNLFSDQFRALVIKEIIQLLRDKKIIFLLIFPTVLRVLLYGFALNPDVSNLKLGILDYAHTAQSQALVSTLTENNIFTAEQYFFNGQELTKQIQLGKLTVGLVIPPDFLQNLSQDKSIKVDVLVDGVDANQAVIAQGYLKKLIRQYNHQLDVNQAAPLISPQVTFLYNSDLKSSWFFVPGVFGLALAVITSLISSATIIREKDKGTLEQLLMTPARGWEILLAKIITLFVLLMGDLILILVIAVLLFQLPFRGNLGLFLGLSAVYILVNIAIGTMLATISRTQQQAYITSFFVSLPLTLLSGVISPIESMPVFFQYLSLLNPVRHYATIIRGILLKGVGLEVLWINAIALILFATILLTISISKFRRQLNY